MPGRVSAFHQYSASFAQGADPALLLDLVTRASAEVEMWRHAARAGLLLDPATVEYRSEDDPILNVVRVYASARVQTCAGLDAEMMSLIAPDDVFMWRDDLLSERVAAATAMLADRDPDPDLTECSAGVHRLPRTYPLNGSLIQCADCDMLYDPDDDEWHSPDQVRMMNRERLRDGEDVIPVHRGGEQWRLTARPRETHEAGQARRPLSRRRALTPLSQMDVGIFLGDERVGRVLEAVQCPDGTVNFVGELFGWFAEEGIPTGREYSVGARSPVVTARIDDCSVSLDDDGEVRSATVHGATSMGGFDGIEVPVWLAADRIEVADSVDAMTRAARTIGDLIRTGRVE